MNRRRVVSMVGAVLAAASLAACGSSTTAPTAPSAGVSASASNAPGAALALAKTTLGEVVVDAKGMTLYMYTKDTQGSGKSACEGQCLAAWPPLLVDATPSVPGITGKLATITKADGRKQVTLDGWPLYYFAKDKAPGDVTGQGVGTVWWVLAASGTPIQAAVEGGNTGY